MMMLATTTAQQISSVAGSAVPTHEELQHPFGRQGSGAGRYREHEQAMGRNVVRKLLRRGLELPLACHPRLAQGGANIGLPELHLGSVPAAAALSTGPGHRARPCDEPHPCAPRPCRGRRPSIWVWLPRCARTPNSSSEPWIWPANWRHPGHRDGRGDVAMLNSDDRTDESLRAERTAFHATLGSPDMIAGMTAFMEKRRPEFNRPRGLG